MTAKDIRDRLAKDTEGTAEAIAALRLIDEMRAKVTRLRHESTHSATDEQCEAAARDLVAATEDVRIGEITEARKKERAAKAHETRQRAGVHALASVMEHFDELYVEALAVGRQVASLLVDPAAHALPDGSPDKWARDTSIANLTTYSRGAFRAQQLYREAQNLRSCLDGELSNVEEMLGTLDAETAAIRAEIKSMSRVLAFLKKEGFAVPADEAEQPQPELAAV